jgi:hypothetical protein
MIYAYGMPPYFWPVSGAGGGFPQEVYTL